MYPPIRESAIFEYALAISISYLDKSLSAELPVSSHKVPQRS